MIDQLRIKCPSCGIILDIRNSKHEAVKHITCPNCKKQLAVNFEEDAEDSAPKQPIVPLYYGEMSIALQEGVNHISLSDCDYVEINVVRLKDGSTKCMVRPLSDNHPVSVNRQSLQVGEQVVLAKGDVLQIGKTVLVLGKPGTLEPSSPEPVAPPIPSNPPKERNWIWVYAALACAALTFITVLLWPSGQKSPKPNKPVTQMTDTVQKTEPVAFVTEKPDPDIADKKTKEIRKDNPLPVKTASVDRLSDYELEKLAMNGNVDAQYELGNRLVHGSNPSAIVRGVRYLRMAANNGSSKAKDVLNKAIKVIQQKAQDGDSIAYYILKSI